MGSRVYHQGTPGDPGDEGRQSGPAQIMRWSVIKVNGPRRQRARGGGGEDQGREDSALRGCEEVTADNARTRGRGDSNYEAGQIDAQLPSDGDKLLRPRCVITDSASNKR